MSDESESAIVAYLAVQFMGITDNNGWVPTAWGLAKSATYNPTAPQNIWDYLPVDNSAGATGANGPPSIDAYSPVMTLQFSFARDYPGSPSGGGPATATRLKTNGIFVQRNVDQVSPILMQYSSTSMRLANVHLVYQIVDRQKVSHYVTWLKLTKARVASYSYDTTRTEAVGGNAPSVSHYESLIFSFAAITFQSYSTSRGWSISTDTAID